ncbi:MAG TPA: hypothetical protein VEL74_03075, partial [Thermoanaerobaculia bacterium]|nr:hypothetical protein [Thermoanaerobaculia bacterium]
RAATVNVPRSPHRQAPVPARRRAYRRPQHELPAEAVDRFAEGRASREERSAVLRHLLTGCAHCQRRLGAFWSCPAPVDTDAYDAMFDRLVAG